MSESSDKQKKKILDTIAMFDALTISKSDTYFDIIEKVKAIQDKVLSKKVKRKSKGV